ncbi:putative ubiquitin-conjugating enzyme E2 39 isoform X2 [Trifolium pratense]|uniref:putative ubiquitin-conjugating enzyme E2 39 isoform X2 n=1 Tax=Trifolium pratense TaxID=57577 RepID=UPI001E692DC1|nr:putative ubiquitin-conjugating enzyme E2 39 isoform X2 [Trifolium pratense]
MMDPDVVEIPPPLHQKPSRFKKQKQQIVFHDVIDLEGDDDLVVLGETSRKSKRNKGKAVETIHGGYGDHQVVPSFGKSGIQSSNGQPLVSQNLINVGGQSSNPLFVEDDYLYKFKDDYMDEDEYALLLQAQFDNVNLPTGIETPFTLLPEYGSKMGNSSLQIKTDNVDRFGLDLSAKKGSSSSSSFHSSFVGQNGSLYPQGIESGNPWLNSSYNFDPPFEHGHGKSATSGHNGASVASPGLTTITDETKNETLRKFQNFKQFDTVDDASDHHFVHQNSSTKQNPKNWAKKIQGEWKILEKHLPETIFVRVFESRMDLLRAVIIGAEGTPYHDGLFFFDVLFPSGYPNEPPLVYYHSRGLRLNPNLYDNGKVCISLLNTYDHGRENEKWTPGVSTMLQVLVSIQGLILSAKPLFNAPLIGFMSGTQIGEALSLKYSEDTFIQSVRTMMYTMKNPPKNFEELVVGHFYSRAHDILASCKAYMEGVQVGCFVKGGFQDVDKGGRKSSDKFKAGLLRYVKLLVQDFEKIGVKDCQKFIFPTSPKQTPLKKLFTLCFFFLRLNCIIFGLLKIFNCAILTL